ncbi:uncharacterized protein F5147DRAFT_655155 [Suillus discolor]|uniref:Uncharacterized protein n=1 Tax=Suillus discolor TaxID=1912936 RepID=A0A9P7F2A1_9AGAM|nr:uncharacterized protein F5147DRAFT_655155 [Suillus discolor]KAG2101830.1 hypothetical protein F5147DRAFT_655155 [Suillus discolor]
MLELGLASKGLQEAISLGWAFTCPLEGLSVLDCLLPSAKNNLELRKTPSKKTSRIQKACKSRMDYNGYVAEYKLQLVRMPFHVPPSLTRGSSQECEYKDEPSQCETDPPLGILEPSPTLVRTIGKTRSQHISQAKRARLPSSDKTDDSILRPITPPPIINDLARFVKRAKLSPMLRIKDSSNTQDRRFFNNQLSHRGSLSVSDAQRTKDVLRRRLKNLSSEAAAQAVVTMHADVEWRRVCCLATAWEIYASEEHLKFLHMVLEDQGERYASAGSEPFGTSVEGLVSCSEEELKDRIDFGVAAYSHDVTSFAVGDTQLDYLENTYSDESDDSGIALTHSEEDRSRGIVLGQSFPCNFTNCDVGHEVPIVILCFLLFVPVTYCQHLTLDWASTTQLPNLGQKILQQIEDRHGFDQWGPLVPAAAVFNSNLRYLYRDHTPTTRKTSLTRTLSIDMALGNRVTLNQDGPACHTSIVLIQPEPDLVPAGGYHAQAHSPQLGYGDDLQAANSSNLNVHESSDNAELFNYGHGYHSLHLYDGYSNTPWQGYNDGSTSTNFGAHGDYLSAGSSSQLRMEPPLHTFPDGHNAVVIPHAGPVPHTDPVPHVGPIPHTDFVPHTGPVPHAGPVHDSMALHTIHNLQLPPDAYTMASSSSHNEYYFARSHSDSNDPQPPSDPMPHVTQKLGQSVRLSSRKATCSRTKFLTSKQIPQESPLSMIQAPSSLSLVFTSLEFIRDVKEDARTTMFKFLFKENLFPSTKENSAIAKKALDDTITRFSTTKGVNGVDLVHWKSGQDGKNLLARMKAVVKEIHNDFKQVATFSWISAYALSHNISMTKFDMQTARITRLTALLSNFLFADEVIQMTMDNGIIIMYRIPFGHLAIFDLLEHIINNMQYSHYVSFDQEDWKHYLTNAIFLAATSRSWSLEKGLAGPWSGAIVLESEENRAHYETMKSRLPALSHDETLRVTLDPEHILEKSHEVHHAKRLFGSKGFAKQQQV